MRRKEQFREINVNGTTLTVGCYGTITRNGCRLKPQRNNRLGYCSVSIYNAVTKKYKSLYVHRLVA